MINAPVPVPNAPTNKPLMKNLPGNSGNEVTPTIPPIKNKIMNTRANSIISP